MVQRKEICFRRPLAACLSTAMSPGKASFAPIQPTAPAPQYVWLDNDLNRIARQVAVAVLCDGKQLDFYLDQIYCIIYGCVLGAAG